MSYYTNSQKQRALKQIPAYRNYRRMRAIFSKPTKRKVTSAVARQAARQKPVKRQPQQVITLIIRLKPNADK